MNKILIIFIVLITSANTWCWDDVDTHPRITEFAVNSFFDKEFLNNNNYTLYNITHTPREWLKEGSRLEDAGTKVGYVTGTARSLNHFHDPTKPLSEAGLSDLPLPPKMSTVLWAQDPLAQTPVTGGDWSWQKVRDHYYHHLIGTDKQTRDSYLAQELLGLGYQMHLIQDMSQPNHVRNDTHMDDGVGKKPKYGFETWAKTKFDKVNSILANNFMIVMNTSSVDLVSAYEGGLAPVARLYDTRNNLQLNTTVVPNMTYILPSISYSQGLAEYTNANFYSENSIFAAERRAVGNRYFFPYPKKSETDLQQFIDKNLPTIPIFDHNKTYQNFRIGKPATTGETLNCIAKPTISTAKYYKALGEGQFFYGSFVADEECFEEQANKLLPRAAGYSIAMLNYFFRGKIEVKPVSTGSSTITVSAKNTATNGDAMTGGTLDLVLRYRSVGDPDQLFKIVPLTDYQYLDIKYPINNQTIDTTAKQFTFDLSATPLPNWANDVTAFLVYHGQLGNEADSVAVGQAVIKGIPRKMTLALPAAGVYGKTSGSTGFTRITVAATANIPGLDLADGLIELVMIHRTADSDPLQNTPVTTSPLKPTMYYYIRASEETGKRTLSQGQTTELTFNISDNPLPIWASDVYMYISYKKAGDPDSMARAVGYLDISEPTPIDVFNNADKICMNSQWYNAGSAAAIALVDTNHDGVAQEVDVYANNITNIYYRSSPSGAAVPASDTDYTISAPNKLYGGSSRRLGYILSDYYFDSSFTQDWVDGPNFWGEWTTTELNTGTAVKHQTDPDGKYTYPGMQVIRGNKIWWGTGIIYDNYEYPADGSSVCSWDTL